MILLTKALGHVNHRMGWAVFCSCQAEEPRGTGGQTRQCLNQLQTSKGSKKTGRADIFGREAPAAEALIWGQHVPRAQRAWLQSRVALTPALWASPPPRHASCFASLTSRPRMPVLPPKATRSCYERILSCFHFLKASTWKWNSWIIA